MTYKITIPDTCEGCGQCCDIPDGNRCEHLDCNKHCSIYEDRPKVCKEFIRGSEQCIKALRLSRF